MIMVNMRRCWVAENVICYYLYRFNSLIAEYWHIGETTTRLGSSTPRIVIGEKSFLDINFSPCPLDFT